MKLIPRSVAFNCLYNLIENHSIQDIEKKDLTQYAFILPRLSSFEKFIIAARLVDCSGKELKSGNVKDVLLTPLLKRCSKYFDISFDGTYEKSYFNRAKWDMLARMNGRAIINTKTGAIENTGETLNVWKTERYKESFKYARYILDYVTDSKLSQDLIYTYGADYLSDMQYFLIGSIYSIFDVEYVIPEHIKIIYLSVLADHLGIHTFKKWEKRRMIDYFIYESDDK